MVTIIGSPKGHPLTLAPPPPIASMVCLKRFLLKDIIQI